MKRPCTNLFQLLYLIFFLLSLLIFYLLLLYLLIHLKEKYIEFNKTEERDLEKINTLLSNIIDCYSHSTLIMFKEFSELLKAHKQEIINSFIYITDNNGNERRLSNGPMEGYNRTPKDFKRNSRGLSNFEYVRSRLIWANRKNESILAIPKSKKEVYKFKK